MMVPIRIPMVRVTRIVRLYARRLAFKRTQKALARWSIVNFLQICVLKIIPFRHLRYSTAPGGKNHQSRSQKWFLRTARAFKTLTEQTEGAARGRFGEGAAPAVSLGAHSRCLSLEGCASKIVYDTSSIRLDAKIDKSVVNLKF